MKILFLDAYFEPEQIAFTHLEQDILQGLVDDGQEIEVVCPVPTRGIHKEIAVKYKSRKSELFYKGRVHVTRFYAPQEGKNPLLRALRYLWCNLRTYQIGKKANGIKVVFANSTPPTQGWIAGKVAKKLGVPFVYSLQDLFPDSLANVGLVREGGLLWKIGGWIEKKTYRNASRIITISEGFRNNIAQKGVALSKVKVIPNWVDIGDVYDVPRNENKIVKKYGLDPSLFYICYSGNIGHSQNIGLLVDAAYEIQKMNKKIEFVIIGEGVAKGELCEQIRSKMVTNIHLLPFQPYDDIAHVFSLGDVGLVISKHGIGGSSVPSKTWSIMAAKRPVLASFDKGGELEKVISEVNCGYLVEAGNKDDFIHAIMKLYDSEGERRIFSNNGYHYVSKTIEKTRCVSQYIKAITKCKGAL